MLAVTGTGQESTKIVSVGYFECVEYNLKTFQKYMIVIDTCCYEFFM
jgi:hypothetical protein